MIQCLSENKPQERAHRTLQKARKQLRYVASLALSFHTLYFYNCACFAVAFVSIIEQVSISTFAQIRNSKTLEILVIDCEIQV